MIGVLRPFGSIADRQENSNRDQSFSVSSGAFISFWTPESSRRVRSFIQERSLLAQPSRSTNDRNPPKAARQPKQRLGLAGLLPDRG
jgi:hypothetical protein